MFFSIDKHLIFSNLFGREAVDVFELPQYYEIEWSVFTKEEI